MDNERESKWIPQYEKWRHGGYYVTNLRYPDGAVGCVAKLANGKWAIACPPYHGVEPLQFSTRDDAANAEFYIVKAKAGAA